MTFRSKRFAIAAIASAALFFVTGCSNGGGASSPVSQQANFGEDGEPTNPGEYGYGVSGLMLPAINQNGENLADDDAVMAEVCQYVEAFDTGTLRAGGESPKELSRDELISDYRTWVLNNLKGASSYYPEFEIYLQGAKEKLADPSHTSDYYSMLINACGPYKAMLTRTIAGWVNPTAVGPGNCWYSGRPSNLRATLQKLVDTEWVTIETVTGFKKGNPSCTDKKYPYGYSTTHTFWESAEIRWVVTTLDGSGFDNGTKRDISDTTTVAPGQSSVW